jgi:uncharacterized protein
VALASRQCRAGFRSFYAISSFSTEDAVHILEYPVYGNRKGVPSRNSFNKAAKEAYLFLRDSFPDIPVCVSSESIGSGPASSLASFGRPSDKYVFIVPFEKLSLVAKDHFPSILVSIVLRDDWDNISAFSNYKGRVDVFGAKDDTVIPVAHAQALAASIPSSQFVLMSGGHNDGSQQGRLRIRNPSAFLTILKQICLVELLTCPEIFRNILTSIPEIPLKNKREHLL